MSKIVDRTMEVFETFATMRRPLSLSDMTRQLDIPISSCHDIVRALESRGYLYETGPRAGYYPTTQLYKLSKVILAHDALLSRAYAILDKLRHRLGESVMLAKANEQTVTYLLTLESPHPIRFSVPAGSNVRSLHATSAGKAYLGSLPSEKFEEYLKSADLVPLTEKSIKTKAKLRAEIEQGRETGWYENREESVPGAITLSGPFRWRGAVYIITVAGPKSRMEDKMSDAIELILESCRELTS